MNPKEMLDVLEDSQRRFDASIDGLDDATMAIPGVVGEWSVQDLVGHVTAWELLIVQRIDRERRGEPQIEPDWASADEYNAREVERRRGWSLAQVRDEAADTRKRLRALLAAITDEEWATVITVRERECSLGDWIGGALNGEDGPGTHSSEHAGQIQAWRDAVMSG